MKIRKLLVLLLLSNLAFSQDTITTVEQLNIADDIDLESLMNVKLTVSSQKELELWETPAVVTVLTQDDIKMSAARDLVDVLRLVPGYEFAQDVNGEIGLGANGMWAAEGKVLVMLDGLQMNENMYGTVQWINQFDINQIDRIEIIRGPGYAFYNGFASLGVINIITKKAKDIQGIGVSATYGQLENTYGRALGTLMAGWQKEKWGIKASVYGGQANKFSGIYTDFDGTSVDLTKNNYSKLNPMQVYVSGNYKQLEYKYYHNNNIGKVPFHLSNVLPYAAANNYLTRQFDISYKYKLNDKISFKPRFNVNYNSPYAYNCIAIAPADHQ